MFTITERKIYFTGLVFFIVAAYFSVGFHHPDEHFQILEFANYKLGNSPAADLPWEFSAEIRQALPIAIVVCVYRFFEFFGLDNPFFIAFVLRLIIGLSMWFALVALSKSLKKYFKSDVAFTIFLVLLFLSWYMPYVSVRFSSENLSALFLVLGLVQYFKVKDSANKNQFIRYFLLGLFFGFSFYFRFQIAFAIAGFGLFILLVDRIKFMHLVWVLIGGILAIFLSICIDYWFYGKWIFSPFNYFTANITNDIASNYGVMPWWHYFTSFLLTALPPISVFVIGFSKNLKNIFVWMFIPFLLAHIAVGHKELRFLFPLIVAFIYVSALGIDYFIESNKLKKLGKFVFFFLLIINSIALIYRTIIPAREQMAYQEFLYDYTQDKTIELYVLEESIYETIPLTINYYKSPNVNCTVYENKEVIENLIHANLPNEVYYIEKRKSEELNLVDYKSETVYSLVPDWIQAVNINDWTSRTPLWKLKRIQQN